MSEDLIKAIETSKIAGEYIRNHFSAEKNVREKGKNDLVTDVDIFTEKIIYEQLSETGYSFYGEESGEDLANVDKKWVVDPIDGTINFIHGVPVFAVSIALLCKNEIVLGVVYNPMTDECFWAEKSSGAFLNDEPIKISNQDSLDSSTVLVEHGKDYASKIAFADCVSKLMLKGDCTVLRHGSTAYMLCLVAKGTSEAFLGVGDMLYDYAAGACIAREAGAVVSDWQGKDDYMDNGYLLVAGNQLQASILDIVKDI